MAMELHAQADRALEDVVRRLRGAVVSEYREAYRQVRAALSEYYERFAVGAVLTHAEMMKYDRLVKLERELELTLRNMTAELRRAMHRDLEFLYEDSYMRSSRALGKAAGVALVVGVLGRERILSSVRSVVSGLSFADRLLMRRDDLNWRLRQVVVRGLVRGYTQTEMVRQVRELFLWDSVRAIRAVNTEAHRVRNEARFAAGQDAVKVLKRAGVRVEKMWVTAEDERVRDAHADMAGQRVAADEDFVEPASGATAPYPGGFNVPELDINCRCEFIWVPIQEGEGK